MGGTDTQHDQRDQPELVELIGPLRRYVGARVRVDDREDVVQETLARVLKARGRLEPAAALAYALVVARHVIIDRAAHESSARRNHPRLIDLTAPAAPHDLVVEAEEHEAVHRALEQLPADQRAAFLAHVMNEDPVTVIARESGGTGGSVAASLARTRARLRVDYVLALRGMRELPTERCRPVLLALSGADSRRQKTLRAGHHLLACEVCASLSEPLLRRRSTLASLLPWLGLGPAIAFVRRGLHSGPAQATAVTTGTALAGAVLVVAVHTHHPRPAAAPLRAPTPAPAATTTAPAIVRIADDRPFTAGPVPLASRAGERVRATSVLVLGVDADEGFWVQDPSGGKLWVQLSHVGHESAVTVRRHDTLSFTGTVTAHGSGFARKVGVDGHEDAELLTTQRAHLSVREQDLHISRSTTPPT